MRWLSLFLACQHLSLGTNLPWVRGSELVQGSSGSCVSFNLYVFAYPRGYEYPRLKITALAQAEWTWNNLRNIKSEHCYRMNCQLHVLAVEWHLLSLSTTEYFWIHWWWELTVANRRTFVMLSKEIKLWKSLVDLQFTSIYNPLFSWPLSPIRVYASLRSYLSLISV
jgi:hypothetical protein